MDPKPLTLTMTPEELAASGWQPSDFDPAWLADLGDLLNGLTMRAGVILDSNGFGRGYYWPASAGGSNG